MYNQFLDQKIENDIGKRVRKILLGIGNPDPPLRVELVLESLRLDRAYFSSSDDGLLRETIHRLKVAGKQILRRPAILADVVRRVDLKALWVPDQKRILINSDLPSPKKRWGEAHEVGHSILPWHQTVMHGDKERTLTKTCEVQVENEANYVAGELLFMQEEFFNRLDQSQLCFGDIIEMNKTFGNSLASTLWHTIESCITPNFALISSHPRVDQQNRLIRYFVRSRSFERKFKNVLPEVIFDELQAFCFGRKGPIGRSEVMISDINGDIHVFHLETFYTGHDALTLGVHKRVHRIMIAFPRVV